MSSTCQTIHYDASQCRVCVPLYNFILVIPKSQLQGPPCVLFCILYTGQCRPQGTSFEVSLPPYLPSSHAHPLLLSLTPLLPLSSAHFVPPIFPSLRPCLRSFLTRSLLQPSLPPLPLPPSLTSSLPPSLPSLILPRFFPASLHRPIQYN